MAHTDPIADLLTRLRNANKAGKAEVSVPYSRLKEGIAAVLVREGFISRVTVDGEGTKRSLQLKLKYTADRSPVLGGALRVSKPSRRVYVGYNDIKQVRSGMGVSIISTPQGLMSDRAARQNKLGGEVLCSVW